MLTSPSYSYQQSPGVVRPIITQDTVERYNNMHAGTLDHSNLNIIEAGTRDGANALSANYKEIIIG